MVSREKKRTVIVAIATFSLFAILLVQFFKVQVSEGERWTKEAKAQHEFIVKEPFCRGTFFSNTSLKKNHPENPQPLVFDVVKFHLFADPQSIPETDRLDVAKKLSLFLNLETQKILEELSRKSRSRKLAMWCDRKERDTVQAWWTVFSRNRKIPHNAIYFVTDYQRCYPFGKLLGQVLHTIRHYKDEVTQEGVPTGGLEAYFNNVLKGKQGKRKLLRSPLNPLEIDKIIEPPENGADIYLTIDHTIQAIVEEELEKGVKAATAKGGWAIVMDPFTGEIYAMAQYPFFEPQHYQDYFNDPEKMEYAKLKPITDCFELGSIMKPITLAICMHANEELLKQQKPILFDPAGKFDVTRTRFPGRQSKPLLDPVKHRYLNKDMAIQKSSNIYMAEIIDKAIQSVGSTWYRKKLIEIFGFGIKTDIELPAESIGMIPTPGKFYLTGAPEWSLSTPYSLAIGYNMLATTIQMVRAYAVFANGGKLVKPTLVRKIIKKNADGTNEILLDRTQKTPEFPQVIDKKIIDQVVKAMKFTTKEGGTGWRGDVSGYTEAGKTGTAEKIINGVYSKKKHISSFVGFAPANPDGQRPPRFVLVVSIDEAKAMVLEGGVKNHKGGKCAAPIFRTIAERIFEYLGEEPDDPHGYPPGDPRRDPARADWFNEVKDLRALYEQWNHNEA